jgi:hypothetical protein
VGLEPLRRDGGDDVGALVAVTTGIAPLVEAVDRVPGPVTLRERTDEGRVVSGRRELLGDRREATARVEAPPGTLVTDVGGRLPVIDDAGVDAKTGRKEGRPGGDTGGVRRVAVGVTPALGGQLVDRR